MNAISTVPPPLAYGDIERLADAIAKSNLFGIKTKEQALVLMMIARSEGRDPVEAARDYDIIQGKPAKKAEAMLRDFLVAGGKVEWHELSDTKADATFIHPQTGKVRIDWDLVRANTAGFGAKDMWKKFPRQMLRSRVVSEGVRTLWPLATSGMYVPEEQADIPAHNGLTLEASPEREAITAAEAPLTPKQQRMRGVDATGKPWRSAEGEDADRAEAAERERAAAAAAPKAERKIDPTVYDTAEPTDADKWWFNLETKLATAQSQAEVMKIGELKSVKTARASTVPGVQERIMELLANAYARFPTDSKTWTADLSDEALGEVQVEGEAKVAAG